MSIGEHLVVSGISKALVLDFSLAQRDPEGSHCKTQIRRSR
jgi:hypothetical protein